MIKSVRNSNHELLRIISMYMIVFIHANMYLGYFCIDGSRPFFNGLVNGICNIGVSCFILISGYYGIKFDIKKLVKMECMMISFSLLETVVLFLTFPEEMQGAALLEQLVKSVLPVISRKYWFYSCYVCLFLLSGYIQKFIECLSKKSFEKFLLLLLVLFSVFPSLFYFEIIPDNGKGLIQMIMVYMIGRYIRLYRDIKFPMKKAGVLFVILWGLNGISHEIPIQIGGIYHHLCKDNSITNLMLAVILFYLFKNLNLKSTIINKVSSYLFAVFALNNSLVTVVMETFFVNKVHIDNGCVGFMVLASVVLLILVVCLLAGVIQELICGRLEKKIGEQVDRVIKRIDRNNL